jgi:hypothetical protein
MSEKYVVAAAACAHVVCRKTQWPARCIARHVCQLPGVHCVSDVGKIWQTRRVGVFQKVRKCFRRRTQLPWRLGCRHVSESALEPVVSVNRIKAPS